MKRWRTAVTGLVLAAVSPSLACNGSEADPAGETVQEEQGSLQVAAAREAAQAALRTPQPLDALFAEAGAEFGVPPELLKAYAYAQTRWEMVKGEEEFAGLPAAFGVMALRGEQIARGASLTKASEEVVRTDPRANIRAAAALFSAEADAMGIARDRLGAWAPVLPRLAGIDDPAAAATFVHDDVYGAIRRGAEARTPGGQVAAKLDALTVEPEYERPMAALSAGPDYPASIWRPSPNYGTRPAGAIGDPAMVVVHTCEGGYTGCWSWLASSASQVSAHYVVKEDGSEITQLVREANRGWHVAASYDCKLNGNVECWRNGYSVNHFSVGIEHAGYASQASFPVGEIDASARLVCDISRDQAIPRDGYHIVGHGRLQPYSRVDPGPHWPWSSYLAKINAYCSSALIVDSNNANNDTSQGYVEVSANWISSSATAGYYGSGYFFADTAAVSDTAQFHFYLSAPATKTIDAWWTAGTNRAPAAPYLVVDSTGKQLADVRVDQRTGGSQWNTLGTWSFPAGWNTVMLSRWTTAGAVVIADAVRVR